MTNGPTRQTVGKPKRLPVAQLASALILSAMLTACTAYRPAGESNALNGTRWTLSDLYGKAVPTERPATIGFHGDRVQGTDGCNRYTGNYASAGGALRIGENLASTRMACPQAVMEQADAFLRALASTRAFRTDNHQLVLLDEAGKTVAILSAQRRDLAGTSWRVTGYNNGRQAVVSVLAGSDLTLDFNPGGRLSGFAGCNNYTAAYATSGQTISITQSAATMKMCPHPNGVMEQEAQMLKALAGAARWRLDGDRLELRTAEDALSLSLSARFAE